MDIIVGLVRKEGEDEQMERDDNETITELRLRYEKASGKKDDLEEDPRPSIFAGELNENETLLK
jgi:hypothetical protein